MTESCKDYRGPSKRQCGNFARFILEDAPYRDTLGRPHLYAYV
jgi:hypothetical protein